MSILTSGKHPGLYIIPPRPDALTELSGEMSKNEPDLKRITEILKQDVSLYTTVLACVNTPAFGLSKTVTSVSHAVMLLGYKKLHTITRLAMLKDALSKAGPLERFWDSATEVATIMMLLARRLGFKNSEAAYSVGMLHDCGIPLMLETHPQYRDFLKKINSADVRSFYQQERQSFKHDHFTLGGEIAARWLMPEVVCQCIRFQPAYIELLNSRRHIDEELQTLMCLLLMAKDISREYRHYWRISSNQNELNNLEPVFKHLGICDYEYKDIQEDCLALLDSEVLS